MGGHCAVFPDLAEGEASGLLPGVDLPPKKRHLGAFVILGLFLWRGLHKRCLPKMLNCRRVEVILVLPMILTALVPISEHLC